jgi:pimeloyl-ACP methyl ester carboxylesterase
MQKMLLMFVIASLILACNKTVLNVEPTNFVETPINLSTHKLAAFTFVKNSKYLVVFESGLGDDHNVWHKKDIPVQISAVSDVLLYDRAGYGKSETAPSPRNINKLRAELDSVINKFANNRKVILVGHSLGGMIIRDYAIKNPTKTAALLFVDASHEMYNRLTQAQEDMIYNAFKSSNGEKFGATLEAKELIENADYMATLPNLPNIPVIALTSMKIDAEHNQTDRKLWFDSKEALKKGVTDFTHITTTKSGHYIMLEEPDLVLENLKALLAKLP